MIMSEKQFAVIHSAYRPLESTTEFINTLRTEMPDSAFTFPDEEKPSRRDSRLTHHPIRLHLLQRHAQELLSPKFLFSETEDKVTPFFQYVQENIDQRPLDVSDTYPVLRRIPASRIRSKTDAHIYTLALHVEHEQIHAERAVLLRALDIAHPNKVFSASMHLGKLLVSEETDVRDIRSQITEATDSLTITLGQFTLDFEHGVFQNQISIRQQD